MWHVAQSTVTYGVDMLVKKLVDGFQRQSSHWSGFRLPCHQPQPLFSWTDFRQRFTGRIGFYHRFPLVDPIFSMKFLASKRLFPDHPKAVFRPSTNDFQAKKKFIFFINSIDLFRSNGRRIYALQIPVEDFSVQFPTTVFSAVSDDDFWHGFQRQFSMIVSGLDF